jgi:hypothetical protein
MLQLEKEEKLTKKSLLTLIINAVFTDDLSRQAAMDACLQAKPEKSGGLDKETTKEVVDHLSDDPENIDAVKEMKKTYAKNRIKELEIVIRSKPKAKAKAKGKSAKGKAKAKAKAKGKAKAKAKASAFQRRRGSTPVAPHTNTEEPLNSGQPPQDVAQDEYSGDLQDEE